MNIITIILVVAAVWLIAGIISDNLSARIPPYSPRPLSSKEKAILLERELTGR